MEVLPFIWVIVVMIWEFYLQSAFYSLSEPFIETSHVHLVLLNVGEVPFGDEKLADLAELSVVMPEYFLSSSAPGYNFMMASWNRA
jgi:hypothetical protein